MLFDVMRPLSTETEEKTRSQRLLVSYRLLANPVPLPRLGRIGAPAYRYSGAIVRSLAARFRWAIHI